MSLPVDTAKLTVLCGGPPTPVVDRVTGEHRTNREGEALFRTEVVVMGVGRPEVFGVRTTTGAEGARRWAPAHRHRAHRLHLHHQGRDYRRLLRGRRHRAGPAAQGGLMRGLLSSGGRSASWWPPSA